MYKKVVKATFALNFVLLSSLVFPPPGAYAEEVDSELKLTLKEWSIEASAKKLLAGNVAVSARNRGKETHEIAFIKLSPGTTLEDLPKGPNGEIMEESLGQLGEIAGELEDIESKKRKSAVFQLEPGEYAVVCNVVEKEKDGSFESHYSMGMATLLTLR